MFWKKEGIITMTGDFLFGFIVASVISILITVFFLHRGKKHMNELQTNHNRIFHIVENTTDFIYYADVYPAVKFRYLSPSAENFFGEGSIADAYRSPERAFRDLHPDDHEVLERKIRGEVDFSKAIIQRWKDKEGKYRWFEEYATPNYKNGRLVALQGVLRNIDERIELQEKLEYQINHDTLTKIYNRTFFQSKFDNLNEERNTSVSIILCDLDELKVINDTYGHKQGDLLIKDVANVLNQFSSDTVTVARIGGDEFVLILSDTTQVETEKMMKEINRQIKIHNESGQGVNVKMSIGHAFSRESRDNMEGILSRADKDMYANKMEKKETIIVS